jgi:hypothetical protein
MRPVVRVIGKVLRLVGFPVRKTPSKAHDCFRSTLLAQAESVPTKPEDSRDGLAAQ